MKPRNFVAKHLRQFNRAQIEPNKRRKDTSSRVACLEGEIASEGGEMWVGEGIELIFDVDNEEEER